LRSNISASNPNSSYAEQAAPILRELKKLGYDVQSLAALRRVGAAYKDAIPVLLKWLRVVVDENLKEELVRSLSVPWAGPETARAFVSEFVASQNFFLKWAIGNGLSLVADDSVAEDVIKLALDKRHGRSREMIVLALSRLEDPRAPMAARSLLRDPDVQGHAVMALRKLKAFEARNEVAGMVDHPIAWVRAEAKKALRVFARGRSEKRKGSRKQSGRTA
jgi:HEAT repeat protein